MTGEEESQPLAVIVGQGEPAQRLKSIFEDELSADCTAVHFKTTEDACAVLRSDGTVPKPVAILAVVIGEDTPTADELTEPVMDSPDCEHSRVVVVSTSLEVDGVDALVNRGRLDWIGYADDLRTEPFVASMRDQIVLYYEHQKVGAVPEVSSLFDEPLSDTEIIRSILDRIELALGEQPRLTLPEGTFVTRKGEWMEEVTLILEGSVALIHDGPTGDVVMHEESTGRVIGLLAVSEGHPGLFDAITTSQVRCVRMTVEQLNYAVQGHPDITLMVANLFIRSLERRLRRAEELHIENWELSEQLELERTHLAAALENLEEARTELSTQERLASLGSLSAGVAHELNNPMAAIQRISEYLADDVGDLLETSPDKRWAQQAIAALRGGAESASLSSRDERKLRRELAEITGDAAVAQRLALAGIRDHDFARRLMKRSKFSLENALQAASIGTQLRNLRSASKRITELVSSLRSYARPDGDTQVDVDIHDNLDDAIRLLSHKLTNVEVTRDYGEIPSLEGHPAQLAQVWTNVLTNAAEAIIETAESLGKEPEGQIRVTTSQPRPGWIRVSIEDNGPGIPADILPQVFEPRFTTKSGQVRFGMGVGLGVSRTIVGNHHGTMRICTDDGGTTVAVDLPQKTPKEEQ